MKRVLFLTYVYPNGYYNASAACTVRIMRQLAQMPGYEVHCVSYSKGRHINPPYESIPDVILHPIRLMEIKSKSRRRIHLELLLSLPIYPLTHLLRCIKHYFECKKIVKNNKFDLVVSQHNPCESVIVGSLLKKKGLINKHVVIFWDNIYGKSTGRYVPKKFGERRKVKMESFIANNSDSLLSLYPIKEYHDKYGDIKAAKGKRLYLGVPSIVSPEDEVHTEYMKVIQNEKINILYSGSIIKQQFVADVVSFFNQCQFAEKINLIFFSKGYSSEQFERLRKEFKGTIQSPGYIPVKELHSIYNYVDFFMSFPGDVNSIRSKCYEYMSYGRPMILFYDNDCDVNISTFSKYPLSHSCRIDRNIDDSIKGMSDFICSSKGKVVPFGDVLSLFDQDTPQAYCKLIDSVLSNVQGI